MAVDKKNIFLSNTHESLPFVSKSGSGDNRKIPPRDVNSHANFLRRKLDEAYAQSLTQKQVAAIRYKEGTYLEFTGQQGYDLTVGSLENLTVGIRLLNIRTDIETGVVKATYSRR